jgi:hypothetical protein
MLNKEYSDLTEILVDEKHNDTLFFAFANTVEILNYHKTNQAHGWMGVRFQYSSREKPNEVLVHFNLLENDALLQQYTLGSLGVNLIYACFHHVFYPNSFMQSIMDNLDSHRVEIDMVSMKGPDLDYVDNRLLGVQLVKNGMTNVVMFDSSGNIAQAADLVYKKDIIAIRGSFRPITHVGFDMVRTSKQMLEREGNYKDETSLLLCEITMRNLFSSGELDERDFLARVDLLTGMGLNVMVSNYMYFYRISEYFNQFTINRLRMVIGVPTLKNLVQKQYYADLKGGVMEAFGRLFAQNVKLYVYPLLENKRLQTGKLLNVDEELFYLYQHLLNNEQIIDLENVDRAFQGIFTRDVLKMIQNGDPGWEEMMPNFVANQIKTNKLFGYLDSK